MERRDRRGAQRRGRAGGRGQRPYGRRSPPPEATGAEGEYLAARKEEGTPMVFLLQDGAILRGVIEYYDRHMIKVRRADGPGLVLRKSHIRYLHRDEDAER